MITVDSLVKNYAAFRALHGISFEVAPGEVVGFLGPNGAGKTTTLRILTGFMPATDGRVEVAGFDVATASQEVRRRVGYLPEDVPVYRDMTVTGFLRYMAGLKDVPTGKVGSEVDRVVELAGLETVRTRLVGKCSKGFRQRTGLAQALLGDPEVLLLDEPTSGLDPNQVAEVRDLIRDLSGAKTVLLSSHILSEVSQICSRVFIIHQGTLVASGTAEDLARRFTGTRVLRARVRGSVPRERLLAIPGVLEVEVGTEGRLEIAVEDPDQTASRVAREILDAGADLLELRQGAVDLEAVFRRVTTSSPGESANA